MADVVLAALVHLRRVLLHQVQVPARVRARVALVQGSLAHGRAAAAT